MVQITAILTSIAFAGVIFVVLGLIFFGGGGQTLADQQLSDAKSRVEREPNSADAYEQLASAYAGTEEFDQAITAARKAVALDPGNFRRVATLSSLQLRQNDRAGAIATVQGYSAENPANSEALIQLAQLAEEDGRRDLARLSYQAFLRLEPDDPNATAIKARIKDLN